MSYKESHPPYEELAVDGVNLVSPDMEHAEASLSWVKEIDVVQFMGADFPSPTVEGERKRIREILDSHDEYSWMIELDGKVIGNVCINSIQESTKKCGRKAGNLTILIGYKDFWGKGIATKVCGAVIDWAKKAGFQKMLARALEENAGSKRTLLKLGFKEIGTEPYDGLVHGNTSIWHNFSIDL